ncbi:APC family permease [Actinoplanes sp. N902-109]|uniref:APC family permease n=1 Tax=Actinoplanes sp. (strain N902-109) TaxID=649831 RepID=UPI0003294D9C|nr:APC family permease [Actinoplanes sp. N902-109]AGL15836.1 amino acid permease [Actinoplanes sp. N902-109]
MSAPVRPPLERSLSTAKIVFLVVAAAAPLAAMIGTVPLAFAVGTGAGVPAVFVFAGVTLLLFSVGYAAMSRHVVHAGGFYSYVEAGLGRRAAVAAGFIGVVAYNATAIGLSGAFAYFAHSVAAAHGLDLPWVLWAAAGLVTVGVLGHRQADLGAKVLCLLMLGEIAALLVLDAAVVGDRGAAALPAASFEPGTVLGAGLGVSLMFAFISFIGFESAALYGEEAADPRRSVPLATYISVVIIASFYAFTSWIAVGAVGAADVRRVAGEQLGDLFFVLTDEQLGSAATTVVQVLLCTSLFASMLALHNAASRYMFALGRAGVLPGRLGGVHPRHGAPHVASRVQVLVTAVVLAGAALAGLDPYVNLATSMLGLGTLGIMVLQVGAGIAVLAFFRRRADRHWWRTGLAPALGVAGLLVAGVLVVDNFALMVGTDAVVVTALPWLLPLAVAAGLARAWQLRKRRDPVTTAGPEDGRVAPQPAVQK